MLYRAHFPGKYLQGAGALQFLPDLLADFPGETLLIASPTALAKALPGCPQLAENDHVRAVRFGGECSERELDRLGAEVRPATGAVIGLGGGKAMDAAKVVAERAGLPVIIVPTIASTDAPCSACAVVYSPEGVFERVYSLKRNPDVVLVDSEVIAAAPLRFLIAGMGDALATWFEARACARSGSPNCCGGRATIAGLAIARACYDTVLTNGAHACADVAAGRLSTAVDRIIEANTLLSGIGFECGGIAGAHAIHNGLTALPQTHDCYHGELVAFGLLAALHLTQADRAEIATVHAFCTSVGLPTTLAAIGLAQASDEELLTAARRACLPGEVIHHEPRPVSPEAVVAALRQADASQDFN